MAEGLFRKYLDEAGKTDIEVRSAGIIALDGFPPTDETMKVMKDNGVDVSGYKSKRITADLINKSDLVLVMEGVHKDFVIRMAPKADGKVHLLKKYGAKDKFKYPEDDGVPDPIGRPIDFYKLSLEIIKEEVKRIVALL